LSGGHPAHVQVRLDAHVQDLAGSGQQGGTRGGEIHLPAGPAEELGTQLFLEHLDLTAEGRLRHVEPLGRRAEMQFFGHCHESL
jgi:hypothetical protein